MLDFVEPDRVAGQVLDRVRADIGFAQGIVEGSQGTLSPAARQRFRAQLRVELEYALGRLASAPGPELLAPRGG
jgi:hypothetical protein